MPRPVLIAVSLTCCAVSLAYAQPLTLTRAAAVLLALDRNLEVIAAEKAWDASRAFVTQTRAIPDPELELEYEGISELTSTGDFGERSFGFTQTIESPVAWWRRCRAAAQAAESTRLAVYEDTKLDVATRAKLAYDQVLLRAWRQGLIEQELELARDFLEKARQRFQAGDVPQLEVLRAEVEEGRILNRLAEAGGALAAARAELNTLLARPGRTSLLLSGTLDYQPVGVGVDTLESLALARRPDYLGARWRAKSRKSTLDSGRAALFPEIELGIFRQNVREEEKADLWRLQVSVSVPLWGAARQRGALTAASAVLARAVAEEENLRNYVLLQVDTAYLAVESTNRQVRLYRDRILPEAERSFRVADRSYTEGKANYLELLEARKTLIEVREELAAALYDHRAATYQLERATGGSLDGIPTPRPQHSRGA